MRKSLRLFSCAVLGAAILAPTVVGNDHAQADSYYGRGYYNNYYPNYGYNYGYNGYYPGYNYNYGYNYGYNNYYPNYNYGYNYNYNYGYNNYNPGYNNYNESGTYRYSNGYLYYILSDGSYYVNYNGRWVRGGDYNNNNSGSNNTPTTGYEVLRNDPHYRYENGTHYYLKDNGDYYYYSNGKWVLVKASSTDSEAPTSSTSSASSEVASTVDSTSSASSEAASTVDSTSSASSEVASTVDSTSSASSEAPSTVDSTSSASSEVASTVDSTSSASSEVASTVDSTSSASSEAASTVDSTSSASSEVASTVDSTSSASSEVASTVDSTSSASSEVASTVDSTSEAASTGNSSSTVTSESSSTATSETGSTSETSSEAPELEKPPYAPETNIDYDKLPKPTLPPTDYRMHSDPRFVDDNGTYYYRVAMTDEETARGIDGYYKWVDGKWKLYNGTANDDPELDPDFHKPAGNDEYMYDDNASSVKLYSENVVGTGKAGEALPFQNVDEFKDYVINNLAPKFIDNAGWDCNVTWEIEDVDNFNASKGSAWARDYVITANLKSGVDDKKYSDVEFGYVKFIYHVEPTENSDYVEVDSAKAAFNEINAQRTAAGLPALTWSDDLYNSTTLPHAKDISHTYNSDGIVYRRESDGSVVANKWLSSGIRELLMSPDATQAAVACVVAGDGTYYWTLNYQ
ncbi:serine protease [Streptococcus salivarius]|uniref:CAP domain-containing protein n=1 Tax=Streptococcus salivarius TaxID=1304 RepID=UPI0012BC75B4|nr:serine protease [Streptococcus salivarius]MTQ58768.1 serine protease [Streptococcus salivarius]MTQ66778.1 serine protease [Streptococcus salivarius]MTQ75232.1 serine protease [Streptococcus salivarius]MTR16227.1 serine protease [Streptococcus salivarius]MTR95565.1 serine protease [Streptococcus salivarius]